MGSRTWVKLWCNYWLEDSEGDSPSPRTESLAYRGILATLMTMAGAGQYGSEGLIKLGPGVGIPDAALAKLLMPDGTEDAPKRNLIWAKIRLILIANKEISIDSDGIIKMLKWPQFQSEYQRQKAYRRGEDCNPKLQDEVTDQVTEKVTPQKEKEKKEEEERRDKKDTLSREDTPQPSVPYQALVDSYHRICQSLPGIARITDQRRQAIRARWRDSPSLEEFERIFRAVEASDFLSGRNGKWAHCGFDWILQPKNWQKIAEGNYANKGGTNGQSQRPVGTPGNRPAGAFDDLKKLHEMRDGT